MTGTNVFYSRKKSCIGRKEMGKSAVLEASFLLCIKVYFPLSFSTAACFLRFFSEIKGLCLSSWNAISELYGFFTWAVFL